MLPAGGTPTKINDCKSALGSIGWLTAKRLDVCYAYGALKTVASPSTNFSDGPALPHRAALARVLCYVKTAVDLGPLFRRSAGLALVAYADASFGNGLYPNADGACRSRTGFIVMFAGACSKSTSSRCRAATVSTAEAELYALFYCVRTLLCIRRLMSFVLLLSYELYARLLTFTDEHMGGQPDGNQLAQAPCS
jgi:hypothetical protein